MEEDEKEDDAQDEKADDDEGVREGDEDGKGMRRGGGVGLTEAEAAESEEG